jgi:hypothetical protein
MNSHKQRLILVLCVLLIGIFLLSGAWAATAKPAAAGPATQDAWWDTAWEYRLPITVAAAGFARQDKPAEAVLNFTTLLAALGQSGAFDPNSIRVLEVDGANNVLDTAVPFQFDKAADYNKSTKAEGTLTWLMKGSTAAGATRRYYIYFDLAGEGFVLPTFTPLVITTDDIDHKGYQSIRLVTSGGQYYYHKPGGGFATLLDAANKDWIGWNSSSTPSGAAGDFRGIPNMVAPAGGGFFHPGRMTSTTTLLSQGPLKATFQSTNSAEPNLGKWQTLWEVFPTYARMTVTKTPVGTYWFLYEGVPGGTLDVNSDFLTLSDATTMLTSATWTSDIPNEEWLFFSDPTAGRSLYLTHSVDDDKIDGYYAMNNLMTVFGFGRNNLTSYLTGTGRQFTFGLVDSTAYADIKPVIYNAYKNLGVTVGNVEAQTGGGTPAATPSLTPQPTATVITSPTAIPTATPTKTATASPTATATKTPTATATATVTPSVTPTVTATATMTKTPAPQSYTTFLPLAIKP